ncbi:MAG TPA: carboxypeptidase regulatory-like domain-containing protein [Vicinamibacterales bacterium]|nr:carboxypeptidase regulatory-like domain-containing protein [Vicinamibacterales bacterium]
MRPTLLHLAIAASSAAALAAMPQTPDTGTIRGRVQIVAAARSTGRPAIADLAPPMVDPIDRRRCVVYLESAPREAFGQLQRARVRMDQRNEQFVPHLLAITVGTTVDFPNSDTTFHNVFSLARGNSFDLGRYPPGKTGGRKFDTPGIIPISCDIHSHMSAYILVFSHPFFAVTDDDGRYTIPAVPPGSYTLMVWSELGRAEPRRVTVADGETVDADFRVAR